MSGRAAGAPEYVSDKFAENRAPRRRVGIYKQDLNVDDSRLKIRVPPSSLKTSLVAGQSKIGERNRGSIRRLKKIKRISKGANLRDENEHQGGSQHFNNSTSGDNLMEDEFMDKMNEEWGKRTPLHDLLHMNYGDKVWNVINRGLFGEVKLWINKYGHISCKAVGKASILELPEKSIIEIDTEENVRKLLQLSHTQW